MSTFDESEVESVATEILSYLKTHPDAADTIEGVVSWWLIRQRYLRGLNQVQNALDLLVQQGLICERRGLDQTPIYEAVDQMIKKSDENNSATD